jgi:hypothetical protein
MMRRVMTTCVFAGLAGLADMAGLVGLAGLAGVATTAGCGGAGANPQSPGRPLPAYDPHAAQLFDDAIEPTAVGYPAEPGTSPLRDNLLRERTQVGDAVVRARVITVTTKQEDRGRTFQLGFHTVEHLAGTGPLDVDFTLRVDAADPAAGIVGAYETRLIGSTFVVFTREFARPGAPQSASESDWRYHIARDKKDELEAVHAAILLDQVR